MTADGAAKRAEARERRRAGVRDRQDGAPDDGDRQSGGGAAMHAARNAAAAAAVAAAVGAARALAGRGDEADDEENSMPTATEHAPEEATKAGETAELQEPPMPQRAPERPQTRRPEGAAPQRVRSMAQKAREQLLELQGSEPESLTALEHLGDGWRATFEVVEMRRIPDSADILATYVVELDDDGDLVRYERLRRYYRAQADLGDEQ